jgi:hypothetical protein
MLLAICCGDPSFSFSFCLRLKIELFGQVSFDLMSLIAVESYFEFKGA